jgi:hypothetical protein
LIFSLSKLLKTKEKEVIMSNLRIVRCLDESQPVVKVQKMGIRKGK